PHPASTAEDAPTKPEKGSYGWTKLQQDNMLRRAAARGLSCVSLCPPNISGAFSGYLDRIVTTVRKGRFAVLDGGNTPCNLVDVNNLAHAVDLALGRGPADGSRLFITDEGRITWADVLRELEPLTGVARTQWRDISRADLTALRDSERPPAMNVTKSLKHL